MRKTPQHSSIKRGEFLKLSGLLGMTSIGMPLWRPLNTISDSLKTSELDDRVVDPPPLPPLEVVALNRLAFAPRPGELDEFLSLGVTPEESLQVWVDQQLDPDSIDDSDCEARIDAADFETLDKTLEQLWADHIVNNDQGWSYRMLPVKESVSATFIRAVYSKRQLFEVLADFWHNHFNVYGYHSYVGPTFVHYDRDVIRANLLGNFREMLEAVASSTSMLYYLDNYANKKTGYNENYARELLELHTLGADHYYGTIDPADVPLDDDGVPLGYVDADVFAVARCFTGWRVDRDTGLFWYYDPWHDQGEKVFMRQVIPADQEEMKDGRDVLDFVACHRGTAQFIATKLCRRLIGDAPPQEIIDAAADTFLATKDNPDQLKQVVRTIVLSDAFINTWGGKVKRPFDSIPGMARVTQAEFSPSSNFDWYYRKMGQGLFRHQAPNGYPDLKEDWYGTTSMLYRWRLCNLMIEGKVTDVTVDLISQHPEAIRTPNEIADYWIDRILGRAMHPPENRDEIVSFLADGADPDMELSTDDINDRLPRAVAIILMGPDFQLR